MRNNGPKNPQPGDIGWYRPGESVKGMVARMWRQIKSEPPEPRETGRQILEKALHKNFDIAVQAAFGLLYDGLLTQQQADYIVFRAGCQPKDNYHTVEYLAQHGIVESK